MSGFKRPDDPTVMEAAPDAIAVLDAAGRIIDINAAAERLFGVSRVDLSGRSLTDLLAPSAEGAEHRAVQDLLDASRPAPPVPRVEVAAPRPGGGEIPVELYVQRSGNGKRPRFFVFLRDVTGQREAEARQAAKEARLLSQRNAALQLNQLKALHRGELDTALREITEVAAHTLGVERVSVWRYNDVHDAITCVDLFERSAGRHSAGVRLTAAEYPSYFRALEEQDVIPAHDAHTDARTCEFSNSYLTQLGIGAMLDASFHRGGRVDGVLCHEHVGGPRVWTADEQSFAVAVAGAISLALEASGRQRALEELVDSRRRIEEIVDSVDGIVWNADAESLRFTFVNSQAERVLGYPREQWTAEPDFWVDHLHPDDRAAAVAACFESTTDMAPHEFEYRMIAADGRHVWLKDFVNVVMTNGRKELRGIMVDITARRQLEEQLRHSQKMEAIGRLAGGVAHDFNNILTIVQGHVALLLTRPASANGATDADSAADAEDSLRQIALAAERAASLTQQMLAISRRQVIRLVTLDLNCAVGQLIGMLGRTLGDDIDISFDPGAGLPHVRADPGMVDQVILNLVLNARDAMPEGGRVLITTAIEMVDEDVVANQPGAEPGRFVRLDVTDTGRGIPAEQLERIFEPFFSTKDVEKGTGLGLATSYGIVRQHKGWIAVESEVGTGTTFRVYLPAIAWHAEEAEAVAPAAPERGGSETILLVEDDSAVRQLVRRVLETAGYRVHEAADGHEALALWHEHGHDVDLLLSDMVMPKGISGLDLTARLRAERPELRVIISSGYSEDVFGRELPADARLVFVQKPYQPRALLHAVRGLLDD